MKRLFDISENKYSCLIRESIDSLCRVGWDEQYMQYLSKSRITSAQKNANNLFKCPAFLFECFYNQQDPIVAQKPHRRQVNTNVCSNMIFCYSFSFQPTLFNNDNPKMIQVTTTILARNSPPLRILYLSWSIKLFTSLPNCCPLCRTPFSNLAHMRTCSPVPRSINTVNGLGTRPMHT